MGEAAVSEPFPTHIEISFHFSARKNCDARAAAALETYVPWRVAGISANYDVTATVAAKVGLLHLISRPLFAFGS